MQVTQKCWTFFFLKVDTPGGSFLLMKSPFLYTIMMLLIVHFYTNTKFHASSALHCDYRYVPMSHRGTALSASLDAILLCFYCLIRKRLVDLCEYDAHVAQVSRAMKLPALMACVRLSDAAALVAVCK